jgi:hypothetical protein
LSHADNPPFHQPCGNAVALPERMNGEGSEAGTGDNSRWVLDRHRTESNVTDEPALDLGDQRNNQPPSLAQALD